VRECLPPPRTSSIHPNGVAPTSSGRILFDEQHRALRQNAEFVAHGARAGTGVSQVDAVRREHDQIDAPLHGIAHDFMSTVAEDDLLASRDMAFCKVSAEFCQMVVGRLLDAVVELTFLLRPDSRNDLDHMEQRDLCRAFTSKAGGNVQGLLVPIGQIHWHQDFPKHWAHPPRL
jgi:hypothetical protein